MHDCYRLLGLLDLDVMYKSHPVLTNMFVSGSMRCCLYSEMSAMQDGTL